VTSNHRQGVRTHCQVSLRCRLITSRAVRLALPSLANLAPLHNLFYLNFAAGTGSDVFVAAVLSYYLAQSRTGFNSYAFTVVRFALS